MAVFAGLVFMNSPVFRGSSLGVRVSLTVYVAAFAFTTLAVRCGVRLHDSGSHFWGAGAMVESTPKHRRRLSWLLRPWLS